METTTSVVQKVRDAARAVIAFASTAAAKGSSTQPTKYECHICGLYLTKNVPHE